MSSLDGWTHRKSVSKFEVLVVIQHDVLFFVREDLSAVHDGSVEAAFCVW